MEMFESNAHGGRRPNHVTPDAPEGGANRRLLFTPASNVLAHAGRCVVLGRALKERGWRVAFAGEPHYLHDPAVAEPGEFAFWPLADFSQEEAMDHFRKAFSRPARGFLRRQVEDELAILDAYDPALVICDFRLTMYISARLRGIPVVSLLGGRWLVQYAPGGMEPARTHPSYAVLERMLGASLARCVAIPVQTRILQRWKMAPYHVLARQYGLELPRDIWDWFIGEHNLILDTETMGPTDPLPAHFTRVGPIIWNPDMPMPAWMDEIEADRPLIYVTMGSTGDPELFRLLIEELGKLDCTAVFSTGGQIDLSPSELPPNVRMARFLPGAEVMQWADLVIFHGGAGTAYQAIAAGAPAIIIATHCEQEFAGGVFEAHSAGKFHTMREVRTNPAKLVDGIKQVLHDPEPFRAGMEALRRDYDRYDPIPRAVECIERLASPGSPIP